MDEEEVVSSTANTKLPLIVAAVALLFGLVGIFFAMGSKSKAVEAHEAIAKLRKSDEDKAALVDRINELEAKLGTLARKTDKMTSQVVKAQDAGQRISKLESALTQYGQQTQNGFKQIEKEINKIHTSRTASAPSQPARTTSSSTTTARSGSSSSSSSASTSMPADGVYEIKKGDNFSKIAARFGIPLEDIIVANPTVDPRRLRVGQKIKLR